MQYFLFYMLFVIVKLHLSAYLCTPSGSPSVQFGNSILFFLFPTNWKVKYLKQKALNFLKIKGFLGSFV